MRIIPITRGFSRLGLLVVFLAACQDSETPTEPLGALDAPMTAALAPIPITSCGTVITQAGEYLISSNLGFCTGPVIDIRVSDVTIRNGGYGIDWNNYPCITAGVGVVGGIANVRLIGVDVRNCAIGVLFENVSGGVVDSAIIRWSGNEGISITGSLALTRSDTVRNSSFFNSGIAATGGRDIIIRDNMVEGDEGNFLPCGIALGPLVTHSKVRHNTLLGPCTGIEVLGNENMIAANSLGGLGWWGIRLGGMRNVVAENSVREVSNEGIVDNGTSTDIRNNLVENSSYGIMVFGSRGTVRGNTVQHNAFEGIRVSASRTRISGNTVLNNGEIGINAEGAWQSVLVENTVLNNALLDLKDDAVCGVNTWRGNRFGTASAPCIH